MKLTKFKILLRINVSVNKYPKKVKITILWLKITLKNLVTLAIRGYFSSKFLNILSSFF